MKFKVRPVRIFNRGTHILYQATKETSALCALSNCLLIRGLIVLGDAPTADSVDLQTSLSRLLFDNFKKKFQATAENKLIMQEFINIAKELNVSNPSLEPLPGSISEFEDTRGRQFFSMLDIPVSRGSFSELGIQALQKSMSEGELGVLYADDEFHTIFKHNGIIYKLIVHEGLHMSKPSAVWESFDAVNRNELMTTDFTLVDINMKAHKCLSHGCSTTFHSSFNCKRHGDIHLPSSKTEQDFPVNKNDIQLFWDKMTLGDVQPIFTLVDETVKRYHGSSVEHMLNTWIMSPEFHSTPGVLKDALKIIMSWSKRKLKPSSEDLLVILNVVSEGVFLSTDLVQRKSDLPEFDKGSDNAIWSMVAYFSWIVEKDLVQRVMDEKSLEAQKVADELMKDDMELSKKMNLSHNEVKTEIQWECKEESSTTSETPTPSKSEDEVDCAEVDQDLIRLLPTDISHLPVPEVGEYFPNFVHGKRLVRNYMLFANRKAVSLTRFGRKLAKRLLKYILEIHKSGRCWGGNWTILDIRVLDGGKAFQIDKKTVQATKNGVGDDLKKFIKLMSAYYTVEGMEGPAFFDEFDRDAMKVPELGSEQFDLFQMFMADHFAFMPPLARSDLIDKMLRVCDSLRSESDYCYAPLSGKPKENWTGNGLQHTLPYQGLFMYQNEDLLKQNYGDSYWDLLRFLRNFVQHGLKYTKVNGIQTVNDLVVLDLMMSLDLGFFITELLLVLIYACKMQGSFSSPWSTFKTSDDETESNDED